jgi:aldehyde dehydrogenase (NAD+)
MTTGNISQLLKKQSDFFNLEITLDLDFRIKCLKKLKESVQDNKNDLLLALFKDLGKGEFETTTNEIGLVEKELSLHIRKLKKWAKTKRVSTPLYLFPSTSHISWQPLGKVLIISPFNYPFMLTFCPLIGAVSAGNTVVLKPSEKTPETTFIIKKIIEETFNEKHVSVITGGIPETEELLEQRWDKIFFTGSTRVGKVVMQAAAKYLTPVVLELGGKNPAIVDSDANLKMAARRIMWGKTLNGGQSCVSADYVFVHESVKEQFFEHLKRETERLFNGNTENNPDFCRIVNPENTQRLASFMEGTTLVLGGKYDIEKCWFEPTVLTNIPPDSKINEDEIFGPILPVYTFNDLREVIKTINNREKPLSLYYFSQNRRKQKEFIRRTFSGDIAINDTVVYFTNPNLPFGGVGYSGMGSYHGKRSFEIFSHERSVFYTPDWLDLPFRYPPYTNLNLKIIKLFLK